jgi:hypothetical protein
MQLYIYPYPNQIKVPKQDSLMLFLLNNSTQFKSMRKQYP